MSGSLDGPIYRCSLHGKEVNAFNPEGCPDCAEAKRAPEPELVLHKVTYETETWKGLFPEIRARCICGASWTHDKDATEEQKLSIFQSHIRYAERVATRLD